MNARSLTKQEVYDLIGYQTVFSSDNRVPGCGDRNLYFWRRGDPCIVGGLIELPEQDVRVLVFYHRDNADIEEMSLGELEGRVRLPSLRSRVATASRRLRSAVS